MPAKLTHDEKLVLIEICKYIINADGIVTQAEIDMMINLADEIGLDDYRTLFEETEKVFTSLSILQNKIDELKTSKNHKKILKFAIQISKLDANIKSQEIDILVYIANSWNIDIKSLVK